MSQRPPGLRPAALRAGARLVCLLGLLLPACATVNPQSAIRLGDDAILAARAISGSLDRTRQSLDTLIDGQALSASLLNTEPLPRETLCSLQSISQSLRKRTVLMDKLVSVYDRFIGLAHQDLSDESGVLSDEIIGEIDRADYAIDAKLATGCPEDAPLPRPDAGRAPQLPPEQKPGFKAAISQTKSLQIASERIRAVLAKLIQLLEKERPVYESLSRQVERSRLTIARALLTKYGSVSPGEVFAPQLAGLGLRWDEREFQKQLATWPSDKQQAMRAAILAVLERRSERELREQIAEREQHLLLLHALSRQHQGLEAGQPLDTRIVASLLVPILKSVNLSRCQGP